MKSKDPKENRIGPVNPFALGGVFIEAAKKLGWMQEEQEERQRRYYITPEGFAEMEKLGLDLQRVVHYKPMTPLPENIPSRHERTVPQPGNTISRHELQSPRKEITLSHHARPASRHGNSPSRREDRPHDRHGNRPHDRNRDRHPDRHRP
ncbi:MAG TPA: hypothetical protein VKV95_12260 [Terriglobia bacterium]|nr:hypothetical protein [Terriglobia bacterium]